MKLSELARRLGAARSGEDVEVRRVCSLEEAESGSVVFALTPELLRQAQQSAAGAVIAGAFAELEPNIKPLLAHAQPKLAFARAARLLRVEEPGAGAHPTAAVADSAVLAEDVSVGPYTCIGEGVKIGRGSRIGAHVVIAEGVEIGEACHIYPRVTIYAGTTLGDRVVVHAGAVLGSDGFGYVRDEETGAYEQFPQIGRLRIADDVEIGANTTIDRGALEETVIGRGAKLDNLVHIGHNVRVGEDVVIAAQTGVSGSSSIADGAVIAGQVGIADHVRIEAGVILGAQCGVPSGKVIRGKGVLFWGTPARPLKTYLKQLAVLARLAKGK